MTVPYLGYGLIDGDSHYYEPPDCFTRCIDLKYRDDAITVTDAESGDETISWRGNRLDLLPPGAFVRALKPGALRELMQAFKAGKTAEESGVLGPMQPDYLNRDARMQVMDQQGVEATLLFPGLGLLVEHHLRSDPVALYANVRAFNRWIEEDWGYSHAGRIFAAPLLPMRDPQLAVAELERVLDSGARIACMKPGHAHHRSLADPVFDPFWARVEEAGLGIAWHMAESGYTEFYSTDFGEKAIPKPHEKSALQWTCFYGDRPIMETYASCILHNLFGRFPKLRFMSVENGSLWVPYLLANMDKMKGMGRSGPWLGGRVEGRPSEIFKEHIWVSPFPEDDVEALVDIIGENRVVMGSDYPHAEGAERPEILAQRAESLGPARQRKFARGNAYEFIYGRSESVLSAST